MSNAAEQPRIKHIPLGTVFAHLTVIGRSNNIDTKYHRALWTCECSCGRIVDFPGIRLRNGNATSCGCKTTKGPPLGYIKIPLRDRFWAKVPKLPPDSCWEWLGMRCLQTKHAYGTLKVNNRRRLAHRLMWELTHGPIPTGLAVCHTCDNPPCVNPDHLFLGTNMDNIEDMMRKGRGAGQQGTRYQPDVSGTNNGRAKLSEDDIRTIRLAYHMNYNELAEHYDVSPSTIGRIVKGDTWKHIK